MPIREKEVPFFPIISWHVSKILMDIIQGTKWLMGKVKTMGLR